MSQNMFRKRVITSIKNAIKEYEDAADVNHPGMTGQLREKVVKTLFEPLIPSVFSIKTNAKIIDRDGFMSSEIDLILYSKQLLPPVMYTGEEILFPAESCFFVIEIKSTSTKAEMMKSYKKAKELRKITYQAGIFEGDKAVKHIINPIFPTFFAFSTDLEVEKEIDRYKEIDEEFNENPVLRSICIIGKGCWAFKEKEWIFREHTDDYYEVLFFLSITINSLYNTFAKRGHPRLGVYLTHE